MPHFKIGYLSPKGRRYVEALDGKTYKSASAETGVSVRTLRMFVANRRRLGVAIPNVVLERSTRPRRDLTGMKFGRWTVVSRIFPLVASNGARRAKYLCRCECGTERLIVAGGLVNGGTKSCGCGPNGRFQKGRAQKTGSEHPQWKGGRIIDQKGYVRVTIPGMGNHKPEHRLVMERVLGRSLLRSESVHHKNGIRTDNRPENLELWHHGQPSGQRLDEKLDYYQDQLQIHRPWLFGDDGYSGPNS